ncbi:hypothetical protein D3C87_2156150 [compost metagenome]
MDAVMAIGSVGVELAVAPSDGLPVDDSFAESPQPVRSSMLPMVTAMTVFRCFLFNFFASLWICTFFKLAE